MKIGSKVWMDGKLIPWEKATVHVSAHAVHYGSSAFEGIRAYDHPSGPAVFRLSEHMERLANSCRLLRGQVLLFDLLPASTRFTMRLIVE